MTKTTTPTHTAKPPIVELFDIGFVTSHFSTIDLKHYLDKLKTVTMPELIIFRRAVMLHQKNNRQHKAFANVPCLTTHQAIIAAIDHEIRKRSWRKWPYLFGLPIRIMLLRLLRGLELREHAAFGHLAIQPRNRQNPFHVSVTQAIRRCASFFRENWKVLLPSAIALLGVILHWLK